MTPTVRLALLSAAILLASEASALAKPHCTTTLERLDFEKQGGRLVRLLQIDVGNLPNGFYCGDRIFCGGIVAFTGVIDESGAIRNLKVLSNSWKSHPGWHASVLASRVTAAPYEPPRLDHAAVCVKAVWRLDLRVGQP